MIVPFKPIHIGDLELPDNERAFLHLHLPKLEAMAENGCAGTIIDPVSSTVVGICGAGGVGEDKGEVFLAVSAAKARRHAAILVKDLRAELVRARARFRRGVQAVSPPTPLFSRWFKALGFRFVIGSPDRALWRLEARWV